jgi:hypothetical protein
VHNLISQLWFLGGVDHHLGRQSLKFLYQKRELPLSYSAAKAGAPACPSSGSVGVRQFIGRALIQPSVIRAKIGIVFRPPAIRTVGSDNVLPPSHELARRKPSPPSVA